MTSELLNRYTSREFDIYPTSQLLQLAQNYQQTCTYKCFFRIHFNPLCTCTATFSFSLLYFIQIETKDRGKKKEKKLRTYFRITSFSLCTFFVYQIGMFFDGSISKCVPMYLFRAQTFLPGNVHNCAIFQSKSLSILMINQRIGFPCKQKA